MMETQIIVTGSKQYVGQSQSEVVRADSTALIARLVSRFQPISLAEMQDVALLDRVDTKYILGQSQLYAALRHITEQYRVLEIAGVRQNNYHTIYFDSPGFDLYKQHHNRFGTRYKVRARHYVDSDLSFFEVKHKTNRGRTIKSRLPISTMQAGIDHQQGSFVATHSPLDARQLEPKLLNAYLRITLVSNHRPERVTIDQNLEFGWDGEWFQLPGIAIAEVKQPHFSHESDFIQVMRAFGIHPTSFSKYCMGACLTYSDLKRNNFKPQLLHLQRTMQGEQTHGFTH